MKKIVSIPVLSIALILISCTAFSQKKSSESLLHDSTFNGIILRNIGPALMSGRISDIAIHPENENIWYITAGSGGVWKTKNAGITWQPIFDDQQSYSIGCITIDNNNPNRILVGTGENIGGRHVGYGDGIYKSENGGKSWENMGLKESYHISKILIHPDNSDIIWVAAQGPLWLKGDERGLYKSVDGGKKWVKTLGDNVWIGVTDIIIHPEDPDILYAATWQRHRNVAAYMGGGPGSGIHKSVDGGDTWQELKHGLPTSNMGKIGLAISPQKPEVIYAAIELDRRTGGVFKSVDNGMTWEKQSNAVSGATGPHYYQELYACPHQFDRIYLVDVRMQISDDGGKTFRRMKEKHKHSDNHAIAFKKEDEDYLLVGSDGGLYESFDLAENWRFFDNLPLTQFYKIAVDDAEPFYNIYGGTQDNNTQGGPSRTDNVHGIRNADWYIVLFADGHQPATEPGNPDIIYAEWQEGNLTRIDRTTGEVLHIQPQPGEDEDHERYNWDAPILVSPHSPTSIYYGSQRVWYSENRGDSWKAISPDLTRNQERITLPIMDQTWSWDAPWDVSAMSTYNTITSISESPVLKGLIYAGTDDGLIQVTEDQGANWRKIEVGELPDVPSTSFVNDIKADLFDKNTVYVALDNHKFGDLNPYLYKSTDKGKSWSSIAGNLPDRTLVWRIVQDHVNPKLFFAATEFAIYCTIDGGKKWVKLQGGVPTISFRDLVIQKRENDLVAASFGRSFFVLDDYSFLREINEDKLGEESGLFQIRDAYLYHERPVLGYREKGARGASHYTAPNPSFGAVFTYYLKDGLKTQKEIRKEKEQKAEIIEFPGWDSVENERREQKPRIWLTVYDNNNNVVRRIEGPTQKGFHRVAWDLRNPSKKAIGEKLKTGNETPKGVLALSGKYSVILSKEVKGEIVTLSEPVYFNVKRLFESALPGASDTELQAFYQQISDMNASFTATGELLKNSIQKIDKMKIAAERANVPPGELDEKLHQLKQELFMLDERFNGNHSKNKIGEKYPPTSRQRLNVVIGGTRYSTYGPTATHAKSLEIAKKQFEEIKSELETIVNVRIPKIEKLLLDSNAPWFEGQEIPKE